MFWSKIELHSVTLRENIQTLFSKVHSFLSLLFPSPGIIISLWHFLVFQLCLLKSKSMRCFAIAWKNKPTRTSLHFLWHKIKNLYFILFFSASGHGDLICKHHRRSKRLPPDKGLRPAPQTPRNPLGLHHVLHGLLPRHLLHGDVGARDERQDGGGDLRSSRRWEAEGEEERSRERGRSQSVVTMWEFRVVIGTLSCYVRCCDVSLWFP